MKRFLTVCILMFSCIFSLTAATPTNEQTTFSIIKPDAVAANHIGSIISRFENSGLSVIGSKMILLTKDQAQKFYSTLKDKPFFPALISYMTSGPVVVQVLQGPDAVAKGREIIGATDPKKADPGTLRADFGTDITQNAVHGSDSVDSAKKEIAFFFKRDELFPRQ
jgi:nucleoside-diphosphate kinase